MKYIDICRKTFSGRIVETSVLFNETRICGLIYNFEMLLVLFRLVNKFNGVIQYSIFIF